MTITLRKTAAGWLATFHGDQSIIDAFGTDTIPTPFTSAAPAATVLATVQARNPGARVVLA